MTHEEALRLLGRARNVLERHLFEADGSVVRDDIAELCAAIDDVMPPAEGAHSKPRDFELERSAA
jgi:hypothetical protein